MSKETISDYQGVTLAILFIFGSTFVIGTGGKAKNDVWIAVLVAILISVPVMLMYARILNRYPGKDLFDILVEVFGKFTGKLFSILYIWFSFHLGSLVLRNFGEFMSTIGFPETPRIIPIVLYASICAIGVKCGIETLAKCSSYFIIYVFLFLLITAFLVIPNIEIENLLPIMNNGIKPVLQGALSVLFFPFGELVVLMMVSDSLKTPGSAYNVYLKALLIGGLVLVYIVTRNVTVLGAETIETVYFPSYVAISRINVGNFLQRLEISVTIIFIFAGFIKISICMLAAVKGVSKLFGSKDYRFLVNPVALLMINLSYIIYDSIMEMFEWAQDIWPYYAFPFQVIFPLIILIAVEIKARIQKKGEQAKESSTG